MVTSEGHVSFVQFDLIAERCLALHRANVGLELDAELNLRSRLMEIAQMQRAEWVERARELPLLTEIAPSERVERDAIVGHVASVLHDHFGAEV